MYACSYDFLPHVVFWQDLYEESQARVEALERQLAALQVADDDEEEEGAEDGAEGDDEDAAGEEDDGDDDADEGGDGEEW